MFRRKLWLIVETGSGDWVTLKEGTFLTRRKAERAADSLNRTVGWLGTHYEAVAVDKYEVAVR